MTQSAKNFSGEELRRLRREKGLTQSRLSLLSKVSKESISQYENGRYKPSNARLKRLLAVLLSPLEEKIAEPKEEVNTFCIGKVYSIQDTPLGYLSREHEINPSNGTHCEFRYEGKTGIHYLFREVRGGWVRTYTEAQLTGKIVREVWECEKS